MSKTFIPLLFFLIAACPVYGQSVIKDTGRLTESVTMADFYYRPDIQTDNNGMLNPLREKSGWALVSSALVPGLGQAANKKWIRAGAYFLADAALLGIHLNSMHNARRQERRYEQFANQHWSVVHYAQWLVNYHDQNSISNPYIEQLRQQVMGETPAFDPDTDWNIVDLQLLRNVERNTPFVYSDGSRTNNFSHVLPDYGSQQYYELISKYYQYGPGWNDFGTNRNGNTLDNLYRLNWDGSDMPFNFVKGANLAEKFNSSYRLAGNMLSLMVLNHLVSAFDAYLTVKLKKSRIETETNMLSTRQVTFRYHF